MRNLDCIMLACHGSTGEASQEEMLFIADIAQIAKCKPSHVIAYALNKHPAVDA